ncbi:MAG TPA: hypothetical protein VNK52_02420 [Hyphomicrobiaceae bacterium]|nr:hypothetical protein [Hyphomicrobiaceae bacterium]
MIARTQITMDAEMQRRAHAKAAELGISFAEYVRRLVAQDLGEAKPKADVSVVFDLLTEGEPTDIARDKDKLIGDAVWQEHLAETRRKPQRKRRRRPNTLSPSCRRRPAPTPGAACSTVESARDLVRASAATNRVHAEAGVDPDHRPSPVQASSG